MPLRVRKNRTPPPPPTCPLRKSLALLGRTWTPGVIWQLSLGPRRFNELRSDLPGVTAKVLAQRLRQLEAEGVVSRTPRPTSPPSVEYALTPLGLAVLDAVRTLLELGSELELAA